MGQYCFVNRPGSPSLSRGMLGPAGFVARRGGVGKGMLLELAGAAAAAAVDHLPKLVRGNESSEQSCPPAP